MTYVVFIRMPSRDLATIILSEFEVNSEKEHIKEFETYEEAEEFMRGHILEVFPWQIVQVSI